MLLVDAIYHCASSGSTEEAAAATAASVIFATSPLRHACSPQIMTCCRCSTSSSSSSARTAAAAPVVAVMPITTRRLLDLLISFSPATFAFTLTVSLTGEEITDQVVEDLLTKRLLHPRHVRLCRCANISDKVVTDVLMKKVPTPQQKQQQQQKQQDQEDRLFFRTLESFEIAFDCVKMTATPFLDILNNNNQSTTTVKGKWKGRSTTAASSANTTNSNSSSNSSSSTTPSWLKESFRRSAVRFFCRPPSLGPQPPDGPYGYIRKYDQHTVELEEQYSYDYSTGGDSSSADTSSATGNDNNSSKKQKRLPNPTAIVATIITQVMEKPVESFDTIIVCFKALEYMIGRAAGVVGFGPIYPTMPLVVRALQDCTSDDRVAEAALQFLSRVQADRQSSMCIMKGEIVLPAVLFRMKMAMMTGTVNLSLLRGLWAALWKLQDVASDDQEQLIKDSGVLGLAIPFLSSSASFSTFSSSSSIESCCDYPDHSLLVRLKVQIHLFVYYVIDRFTYIYESRPACLAPLSHDVIPFIIENLLLDPASFDPTNELGLRKTALYTVRRSLARAPSPPPPQQGKQEEEDDDDDDDEEQAERRNSDMKSWVERMMFLVQETKLVEALVFTIKSNIAAYEKYAIEGNSATSSSSSAAAAASSPSSEGAEYLMISLHLLCLLLKSKEIDSAVVVAKLEQQQGGQIQQQQQHLSTDIGVGEDDDDSGSGEVSSLTSVLHRIKSIAAGMPKPDGPIVCFCDGILTQVAG